MDCQSLGFMDGGSFGEMLGRKSSGSRRKGVGRGRGVKGIFIGKAEAVPSTVQR